MDQKPKTIPWLWSGPCEFIAGATNLSALPTLDLPEVAFVGRSNVGKSSLINALTGRKKLARTSHTPGRTQAINFFRLRDFLYLVDLPGYGYAKVSHAQRAAWNELIDAYLCGRTTLRRVLILVDSRRGIGDHDRQVMDHLDAAAVPYQIVFTKADECRKTELDATLEQAKAELQLHPAAHPDLLTTSADKKYGILDLQTFIAHLGGFLPTVQPEEASGL